MTDFDQRHHHHHSSMLIRPSLNSSPSSNEFYDSAIELLADDYNNTSTTINSNTKTTISICDAFNPKANINNKNCQNICHNHQIDHCCCWANRLLNNNSNSNLNSDDCHHNNITIHSMLNRSKLNGNDSKKISITGNTNTIVNNKNNQMSVKLDQIDTSSSSPPSTMFRSTCAPTIITKTIDSKSSKQQKQQQYPLSKLNQISTSSSSLTTVFQDQMLYGGKIGNNIQKHYRSATMKQHHLPTLIVASSFNNIQADQQQQKQQVAADVAVVSPLRSSRSFTARYCPRPNVTLIRRKSASERLAESKSKYIRKPSTSSPSKEKDTKEGVEVKKPSIIDHHQPKRLFGQENNCDHDNDDDEIKCSATDVDIDMLNIKNNNNNHNKPTSPQKIRLMGDTFGSSISKTKSNHSQNHHYASSTLFNHSMSFPSSNITVVDHHNDHPQHHQNDFIKTNGITDTNSLVFKINSHLNNSNLVKKRISPRLSENSTNGSGATSSILELQLRELISLDTVNGITADSNSSQCNDQCHQFVPIREQKTSLVDHYHHQQQHNNRNQIVLDDNNDNKKDIYRAELKYIGSSSSSSSSSSVSSSSKSSSQSSSSSSTTTSCSIYSEPYNVSSSPEKMKRNDESNLNEKAKLPAVQPSIGVQPSCNMNLSIVRSKSDVCGDKNRFKNNNDDIGRLIESLYIDSNQVDNNVGNQNRINQEMNNANGIKKQNYSSRQSSNQQNYSTFSSSIESLEKIQKSNSQKQPKNPIYHHHHHHHHHHDLTPRSSTNDFSSFDSSTQFSVDDSSFLNRGKRTGSTSKLTFENLMLHQQNLASSRSCNNLLMNMHNGSSVVERNARIIKWLFNCRKAMDQSTII